MELKSEVLKRILKERGITQKQLAGLLDVTEEFLSRVIRSEVNLTPKVLFDISRVLGLNPATILQADARTIQELFSAYCQSDIESIKESYSNLAKKINSIPQDMAASVGNNLKKVFQECALKGVGIDFNKQKGGSNGKN